MKKLFLALILFGFVFAGVSLACVCYINPDGSSEWCEPAGCDETESYCVEEASYCIIGSRTLSCCEGLKCDVATKKCVVKPVTCGGLENPCCPGSVCNIVTPPETPLYCSKEYYDLNGVYHKVTNPHCCKQDTYWNENLQKCTGTESCLDKVQITCPIYSGSTAEYLKCVYKLPTPTKACCSMNVYGKTTDEWGIITIY